MRNVLVSATFVIAACSSGSGPDPDPQASSPGGLWSGTRVSGSSVFHLITESGELRIIDEFGHQGVGTVSATAPGDVTLTYELVPRAGATLIDGSDSATCTGTGTLVERQALTFDNSCQTSLGGTLAGPLSLSYSDSHALGSDLSFLTGSWAHLGETYTIDAAGVISGRYALTGCEFSGAVSMIDPDWNIYRISLDTANCDGGFEALNGASWDGLLTFLAEPGGDQLFGGVSDSSNGDTMSFAFLADRI